MREIIYETITPIPGVMPDYHPDAADINEALDHGVASCAARAFAATLLLREELPNQRLYIVEFGYSQTHGGEFVGSNGRYLKMGHAVARLWVPERAPLIIESYADASLEVVGANDSHDDFLWGTPEDMYSRYLSEADMEVEIDPDEIIRCMRKKQHTAVMP